MNKQQLTAKQFLTGAHCIDQSIQSKLEQMQSLKDLATLASTTMSDMPGNPNRNLHRMEDTIVKIVDLQEEIQTDIDELIKARAEIRECINQVDDREGRLVLEERYLMNSSWEDIAIECGCCIRQVFRIHDTALKKIVIPETCQ